MTKTNPARVLTQSAGKDAASRKQSGGGSGHSVIKSAEPLSNRPSTVDEDGRAAEPDSKAKSHDPAKQPDSPVGNTMTAAQTKDNDVNQVDQELADDLDELVEGDFESVDEVLDGELDEPNHPLEVADAQPAHTEKAADDTADEQAIAEPAPPSTEEDGSSIPDEVSDAAAEQAAPDEHAVIAEQQPEEAPLNEEPLNDAEDGAESTEDSGTNDAPSGKGPYPPVIQATDSSDEKEPAPEPATSAAPEESDASTPSEDKVPLHMRMLTPVAACGVAALSLLSAPLRYVPESFRPLVDWIAISLVFWVPVVWVLAFVLAG